MVAGSKLPRKVLICGMWFKVRSEPRGGGSFDIERAEIGIGPNESLPWRIFIHEVLEVILAERMHRYQRPYKPPDNGDYLFSFDHAEFDRVVRDLYAALRPFLEGKSCQRKSKQSGPGVCVTTGTPTQPKGKAGP
jgi:hypothetical protein